MPRCIAARALEPAGTCHRSRKTLPIAALLVSVLFAALFAAIGSAPAAAEPVAEPSDYRNNEYRTPVPATLKGAKVVGYDEAKALFDGKGAIFIDVYPRAPKPPNLPAGTVWRDPPHESIPGAHWLANVGYGVLAPAIEAYFSERLAKLSGGDKTMPLVFFCLRDCWMSWNAAKRAMTLGYANVVWFPDGVDAWRDNDLAVDKVEPLP